MLQTDWKLTYKKFENLNIMQNENYFDQSKIVQLKLGFFDQKMLIKNSK